MRPWSYIVLVIVAAASLAAACSGDEGESTTTAPFDPVTTLAPTAGSTAPSGSVTATTDAGGLTESTTSSTEPIGPPEYEIAQRTEGDAGATVVVVLDPASYTSLSDIDLQSVIRDVYDKFPPIVTAHVVDTDDVVELVAADRALTVEERALLDEHYFARLEDGIRIVFLGPFDEYDIAILGS